MQNKYCRICWNSSGWKRPTGEAAKLEGGNSYTRRYGYGHEEWLFNFSWMIDGYHYSHLQPIGKFFTTYSGNVLDVILYTFYPSTWFFVGKIKDCEVISRREARRAFEIHKDQGWIDEMAHHLNILNIKPKYIRFITDPQDPTNVFNIKFKRDSLDYLDSFAPVPKNNKIRKLNYYHPLDVEPSFSFDSLKRDIPIPKPSRRLKSETIRVRRAQKGAKYDPHHDRIQNALYRYLKKKHGPKNVLYEDKFVDVQLKTNSSIYYYEVKTENTVKACIREAMGQLVEYACYPDEMRANKLIVVGEHYTTQEDRDYIDHLRKMFGLPIEYCYFDLDKNKIVEMI